MPGYMPGAAGRTMWVRIGPEAVGRVTDSLSMTIIWLGFSLPTILVLGGSGQEGRVDA
jgi:hypothetical protein